MVDPATVGWGLITVGVILLLVEASMPGFFVGIPGTVLLVLGVLAFVAPEVAFSPVWAPIITIVVGVPATLGTIMFYKRLAPANRPPTTLSGDSLVGRTGRVTRPVDAERRGKVRIDRTEWQALSRSGAIPVDAKVRIVAVDGVTIIVEPAEPADAAADAFSSPGV